MLFVFKKRKRPPAVFPRIPCCFSQHACSSSGRRGRGLDVRGQLTETVFLAPSCPVFSSQLLLSLRPELSETVAECLCVCFKTHQLNCRPQTTDVFICFWNHVYCSLDEPDVEQLIGMWRRVFLLYVSAGSAPSPSVLWLHLVDADTHDRSVGATCLLKSKPDDSNYVLQQYQNQFK